MKLLHSSRKNFLIALEPDQTLKMKSLIFAKQLSGVTVQRDGNLSNFTFEKHLYPSVEIAEKFVRVNTGEKIVKEVSLAIEKAAATDEDLALINKLALVPLKTEEIATYKLTVANNKVDRDQERFNEDVLQSFQKSIVGKGFLFCHNKQYLPIGNVYKSALETGNGQTNLVAWIYILKSADFSPELIKNIDAGIWRYVSIGFMAPKWVAITDQNNGNVLFYEYQNSGAKEAEALEVSLVWLGAQYGAQVADGKNANNGRDKSHHQKGESKTMKVFIYGKAIDVAIKEEMSEEQIADAILKAVLDTPNPELGTLKTQLDAANKSVDIYKEDLASKALAAMANVITMDDAEKTSQSTKLKSLTVESLTEEKTRWEKKASDKSGPDKSQTEGGGKKPEEVKISSPAGYQSPA